VSYVLGLVIKPLPYFYKKYRVEKNYKTSCVFFLNVYWRFKPYSHIQKKYWPWSSYKSLKLIILYCIMAKFHSSDRWGWTSSKFFNIPSSWIKPILSQVLTGNFLLLLLYFGCTTNQSI